jgi:rSAM/selenodomain-associated transferase 2
MKRLSIIIPTLNEADNLAATLAPLQALRDRLQIIVADGGSDDATRQVATPLVDSVVVSAKGRARQMNAGAAAASGKLLLFLHADTVIEEAALTALLALSSDRVWGRFNVHITGRHWMLPIIAWFMNQRSRITGIATGDQGMFVSRDLFHNVAGFSDMPLMEDVDLSIKLKKHAPNAYIALQELISTSGRRWESRGVFRTIGLMWSLRLAFWRGVSARELYRRYYGA